MAVAGIVALGASSVLAAPQALYVGNDNAAAQVNVYALPISGGSTPAFTKTASNNVVAVAADGSGNLVVGSLNGNLQFFPSPLTGASASTATFSNGGASNNGQAVFTSGGDLFAATVSNKVNFFTHPFSNASVPTSFITDPSMVSAIGTAMDAAQNLYVGNAGPGTAITCSSGAGSCSTILVYAPPYTGAPIITPLVPSTAYRKLAVSGTQLFAGSVTGATGRVDVYNLPITNTSTPAFSLTTGMNTPEGLALDASGNLYVGNLGDSTVKVFNPPFTIASAPSVSLTVGPSPFAIFGIAVGPAPAALTSVPTLTPWALWTLAALFGGLALVFLGGRRALQRRG